MEAETKTDDPLDLQSIKGLIDIFFAAPSSPVQEELWKWLVFAISSKGLPIFNLTEEQFKEFSEQFSKLISATYKWANLQKADVNEVSKGDSSDN